MTTTTNATLHEVMGELLRRHQDSIGALEFTNKCFHERLNRLDRQVLQLLGPGAPSEPEAEPAPYNLEEPADEQSGKPREPKPGEVDRVMMEQELTALEAELFAASGMASQWRNTERDLKAKADKVRRELAR